MTTFILLTEEEADTVRGQTSPGAFLDPRLVDNGEHAGGYVLTPEVLADPAHAMWHDFLAALPTFEGDPDEMWDPVY